MDAGDRRAFTLIELLVVIAIVAVVSTVVVSVWSYSPQRNSLNAAAKEFFSLVQDARFDAIGSGRSVFIEVVDHQQLRAVRDTNGNQTLDSAADYLRKRVDLPTGMLMVGDQQTVMFNNRGILLALDGQPAKLDLNFCERSGAGATTCKAGGWTYHLGTSPLGMPSETY